MSKVEGGGGPIDSPSRLRVTIFSSRLLGLTILYFTVLYYYCLHDSL